jgi:hypothetical protein
LELPPATENKLKEDDPLYQADSLLNLSLKFHFPYFYLMQRINYVETPRLLVRLAFTTMSHRISKVSYSFPEEVIDFLFPFISNMFFIANRTPLPPF